MNQVLTWIEQHKNELATTISLLTAAATLFHSMRGNPTDPPPQTGTQPQVVVVNRDYDATELQALIHAALEQMNDNDKEPQS